MSLLERALESLRCPGCGAEALEPGDRKLGCPGCGAGYPIRDGIVDFCPDQEPSRDRAQRAMESPAMVRIYEDYWRPWFTALASPMRYEQEQEWLLARHAERPVGCALDVGAGTGRYARLLAEALRPRLVIALDLSLPMLVNGRRRAAERGCDDILFVRGDAQRLPVRDGAVDLLNCFGALHLFPDPERAIREMARSAKPGTLFSCLTTGRPGARSGLRERLLSRLSPLRLFEAEELAGMLAAAGFEDFRPEQHGLVLLFTARTALESG